MANLGSTSVHGDLDVSGSLGIGVYDSVSDVPNIAEGSLVYIRGEGLHVEDGT
jgi:hypothetical protein